MSAYDGRGSVTEASNQMTENIDVASPLEFISMLKVCDEEIFSGWKEYKGLFHDSTLAVIDRVRNVAASVLKDPSNGLVVLSGCGTSGRLAYMTARSFNSKLSANGIEPCFRYTIAGGDKALFTSQESPEDDPYSGIKALQRVSAGKCNVLLIGITCGLSAPFVAGQLDYCLQNLNIFTPVLLGFNPTCLARNLPIERWNKTFLKVVEALKIAQAENRAHILNPVVGPEQITGSSRMKSGTATKILLETIFASAYMSVFHPDVVWHTDRFMNAYSNICGCVYSHPDALAELVTTAGESLKNRGHIYYIAWDTLGLVSIIDASECPPTYGASLDDVRGFVEDGFTFMQNDEGNLSGLGKHFRISSDDFTRDVLPTLTDLDFVIAYIKGKSEVLRSTVRVGPALRPSADIYMPLCLPEQEIRSLCGNTVLWKEWSYLFSEIACKWICNAVSTGAHILKGKVYRNIMVDLRVSNNKLFHRAVGIIERFTQLPKNQAQSFLLMSIYNTDRLTNEQEASAIASHIEVATPQEKIVPCALLTAFLECPIAEAKQILSEEPVIRTVVSKILERQ
ncbi:hypothetical protein ScPMuIL_005359 [Solemya velum]